MGQGGWQASSICRSTVVATPALGYSVWLSIEGLAAGEYDVIVDGRRVSRVNGAQAARIALPITGANAAVLIHQ